MRIVIDTEIIRASIRHAVYDVRGIVLRITVCSHRGHVPYTDPLFGFLSGDYCQRCWKRLGFPKGRGGIVVTKTRPGIAPIAVTGLDAEFESPLHGKEGTYADHQP